MVARYLLSVSLKGCGVLPASASSLLKVHYHHQRHAAGVNLSRVGARHRAHSGGVVPIIPAEAMPFCGEGSCHGEYRRHSQTGHKDANRRAESAFKWLHSFPRWSRVLVGGVGEDLFCAKKSREQDASRTGRGLFFFYSTGGNPRCCHHTISESSSPERHGLILNGKQRFYARKARVRMNYSTVPAG